MSEFEWKKECPAFNGEDAKYKSWKNRVEDWLSMVSLGSKPGTNKQLGLQIRLSLEGKARELTECLDRKELEKENGHKIILKRLDEIYLKDNISEKYLSVKKFLKIERKPEESMRDYLTRYEKYEGELNRINGENMFGGDIKAVHVLEQARLTESQKQMVLSACGKEKIEYENMCQIMKRIFEGTEKKEESEWLGSERHRNMGLQRNRGVHNVEGNEDSKSEEDMYVNSKRGIDNYRSRGRGYRSRGRGGRNPLDARGRVSVCVICHSEWHWAKDCPQNYTNRKKEANKEKIEHEEIAFMGDSYEVDEGHWRGIEAILDTGCKSTVCGEF